MYRRSHERFFGILLILFVVGVGLSIYYQSSPFFDYSEELFTNTEDIEEEPEAQVVFKTFDNDESKQSNNDINNDNNDIDNNDDSDYFINSRLERERVRSRQIDLLKEIIDNPDTSDDIKSKAQDTLLELTNGIELERKVENIILAKGFKDCLAFVSDSKVDIVVKKVQLDEKNVSIIGDAASRTTGISLSNIAVIARE